MGIESWSWCNGGGVAGSQGKNDWPATVQALTEPGSGTDEGRAMAQIVYDEAPGVPRIIFATGAGGPTVRAANIDALVGAGSGHKGKVTFG